MRPWSGQGHRFGDRVIVSVAAVGDQVHHEGGGPGQDAATERVRTLGAIGPRAWRCRGGAEARAADGVVELHASPGQWR